MTVRARNGIETAIALSAVALGLPVFLLLRRRIPVRPPRSPGGKWGLALVAGTSAAANWAYLLVSGV